MYKQRRMLAASKYAILKVSQFDDDDVIALVEHTPAFNRDTHFKDQFKALSDAGKSVKHPFTNDADTNHHDGAENKNTIVFG
jgi:hypothetical protein